ncbi:MAG: class I SAM-dependent methyltransferase [Verrucomicrobiota bacterium]
MQTTESEKLKEQVRAFWNQQSCDTQAAQSSKFSKEYFEEIESFRYFDQPFIHAFAQFTRYHGKKVLEVGFGAGTDFIQWLRAGAAASGIDLTPEALENLQQRIHIYGLPAPQCVQVGDAENLPFESNSFDLGYSFGVLHHSPDTIKAIGELIRVVKPGGEIKIMVYNRYSIYVINRWVRYALLRGKPWKSLAWVLWHHNESIGTKSYTRSELKTIFKKFPVEDLTVHTEITSGDHLSSQAFPPLNLLWRFFMWLAGERQSWFKGLYTAPPSRKIPGPFRFTGNRLGFYHCIHARKIGG